MTARGELIVLDVSGERDLFVAYLPGASLSGMSSIRVYICLAKSFASRWYLDIQIVFFCPQNKNPTSLLRNGVYYSSIDTPLIRVANKKTSL